MSTAVKAKLVGRQLSPSLSPKSPSEAGKPLNREVHRERDTRNSVPVPPARFFGDRPRIDGTEKSRVVPSPSVQGWKRAFDVSFILICFPFVLTLMVLIAFWIRLVSSGPALFRQERIGKDGKRFVLYKFRTMKIHSSTSRHENHIKHLVESNSPMIKLDLLCDSRLIPGGCMLRAAGLDELPQLLNILRGEMSLVGPRPCLPAEYAFFSPRQRERFKVLPGLTGIWQVSGKNQTTFNEMNLLDIDYTRNCSPILDFQIMLRTPWALLIQMSQALQQRIKSNRKSADLRAKREEISTGSYQKVG